MLIVDSIGANLKAEAEPAFLASWNWAKAKSKNGDQNNPAAFLKLVVEQQIWVILLHIQLQRCY